MKCLVFSDTHGDFTYARAAMALHRDCEVVFFLGDGLRDIEQLASIYPTVAFIAVRGNCDFNDDFCGAECKKVESITLLGKRIVLTHGDLYSAKSGDERLLYLARERGADILLYGHTHTPRQEYLSELEMYLFNPGAASGYSPTYGIILLEEGRYPLLSHGSFR
ncbi:MAG: metallophosphoesterase [Clostridia bacterium]|nr:metallophosphoesterase [Clostridia bacterium]